MKLYTLCVALAAALALPLATGCSKETTEAAGKTTESMGKDMKELGGKAAEAAKQIPAQLEALKKSAEDKMPGAEAALTDLKKKAEAATGDAKAKLDELMQQLKAKKDELAKAVSEMDLKSMSADAYAAAKTKVEALSAEITKLVEKAKSM